MFHHSSLQKLFNKLTAKFNHWEKNYFEIVEQQVKGTMDFHFLLFLRFRSAACELGLNCC